MHNRFLSFFAVAFLQVIWHTFFGSEAEGPLLLVVVVDVAVLTHALRIAAFLSVWAVGRGVLPAELVVAVAAHALREVGPVEVLAVGDDALRSLDAFSGPQKRVDFHFLYTR